MQLSCEMKSLSQMLYMPRVYIGWEKQTSSWKRNPLRAIKYNSCYGLLIPGAHTVGVFRKSISPCLLYSCTPPWALLSEEMMSYMDIWSDQG